MEMCPAHRRGAEPKGLPSPSPQALHPQAGPPTQTDLTQLLPLPSSPLISLGPFLMAHFRRRPQPAPLMEAASLWGFQA